MKRLIESLQVLHFKTWTEKWHLLLTFILVFIAFQSFLGKRLDIYWCLVTGQSFFYKMIIMFVYQQV